MMRTFQSTILMLLVLTVSSPLAHAGNIVLYNTGVNTTGTLLASGTTDSHYTLTSNPAVGGTSTTYVVSHPNSAWAGNTATSQWLDPVVAGSSQPATVVNGEYDYATTFSLTGFYYTTASITGKLSADDTVSDILINGFSTGQSTPTNSYAAFHNFSIGSAFSADFLPGLNTITFKVKNTANGPSGLQVQIAGTANTPEPASYAAFVCGGFGLLGLGLKARKRQVLA